MYPDEPHDGGGDDRETVMVLALASTINIVGGSSASVKEKHTMLNENTNIIRQHHSNKRYETREVIYSCSYTNDHTFLLQFYIRIYKFKN